VAGVASLLEKNTGFILWVPTLVCEEAKMPDAAKLWLETYDDLGVVWNRHGHPADIIRRLLAENERLEASVLFQRKSRENLKKITLDYLYRCKQLEADRDALVAYVRANGGNMVEAYEALSDELKELIDEGR
jgi:hypothetical protein